MSVELLTEHRLEFLSLKGGCTSSSESTLVKMPHCWKSHVTAHLLFTFLPGKILNMDYPLGYFLVEFIQHSCQAKTGAKKQVFIS